MAKWLMTKWLWIVFLAVWCGAAAAQTPPTERQLFAEKSARRFPQPVRVGDLFERQVLEPTEAQAVLGRVVALTKSDDGGVDMLINEGGWFGFGGRLVTVPIEALALMGEYVVAMELTPAQLESRSTATRRAQNELSADAMLRMAIVRPFH